MLGGSLQAVWARGAPAPFREYVDHYAGSAGPAKAAMRVLGDVQAVLAILLDDEKLPA